MSTYKFQPLQGFLLCEAIELDNWPVSKELIPLMVLAAGPGSFNPVTGTTGPQYAEEGQIILVRNGTIHTIEYDGKTRFIVNAIDLIGIVHREGG